MTISTDRNPVQEIGYSKVQYSTVQSPSPYSSGGNGCMDAWTDTFGKRLTNGEQFCRVLIISIGSICYII